MPCGAAGRAGNGTRPGRSSQSRPCVVVLDLPRATLGDGDVKPRGTLADDAEAKVRGVATSFM